MQLLSDLVDLSEKDGISRSKMYFAIWREAQLHAGRNDNAIGEALYEWILLDSTGGDLSGSEYFYSDGVLLSNLVGECRGQGKMGQSRYWSNFGMRYLENYIGCSLETSLYPAQGSLFPWLPAAQSRIFPMRYGEQSLPRAQERLLNKQWQAGYFMHRTLFSIHKVEMWQSFYEGNWVRAAELADWLRQYVITTEAAEAKPPKKNYNWNQRRALHASATEVLEEITSLHGFYEEGIRLNLEALEEYPSKGHFNLAHVRMRRLKMIASSSPASQEELEEGLAWLTGAFEAHFTSKWSSPWTAGANLRTQISILHGLGRDTEALAVLAETKELFPEQQRYNLSSEITLANSMSSIDPQLEAVFEKLLSIYRDQGLKIYEPGLYRLYAAYLFRCGRLQEAIAMQEEALRLYKALGVEARVLEALATLAKYQAAAQLDYLAATTRNTLRNELIDKRHLLTPELSTMVDAVLNPRNKEQLIADLQPLEVLTMVSTDETPEARFLLTNPTKSPVTGKLSAVYLNREDTPVKNLTLASIDGSGKPMAMSMPFELTIDSGEQIPFYLSSPTLEPGQNVSYALIWQENGNSYAIQSLWHTSETNVRADVDALEASLIQQNSFYQVPLHHFLRRTDIVNTAMVDFRLVSETPVRIEVYGDTGELLFIDANADGDFDDPGDLLAVDTDKNGFADVTFHENQQKLEIEIYWTAKNIDLKQTVSIHVELLKNGSWEKTAVDEIQLR